MAAQSYNFSIDRGADFAYGLRIRSNNQYEDFTTWNFASEIRNAAKELVGQFEIEKLNDGRLLRVGISGTATRLISDSTVFSDLFAYPPDGRSLKLLTSRITVKDSVTGDP